jgi:hypothetical protein
MIWPISIGRSTFFARFATVLSTETPEEDEDFDEKKNENQSGVRTTPTTFEIIALVTERGTSPDEAAVRVIAILTVVGSADRIRTPLIKAAGSNLGRIVLERRSAVRG